MKEAVELNSTEKAPFKKLSLIRVKLGFDASTNSNMQNSLVIFTFSVLEQKYLFWANLVQKIDIFSLS